ncbi:MAG: hypothetical protein AB8F74_05560 [Saprospiraceae bacterium]
MNNYYSMKLLAIFFLLCFTQTSFSQEDTLWVRGELQDDVIQNVGCGVAILSFPGKIKIEEYSDTTYYNKEIMVLFICPSDFGNDELIGGKMYEIVLSSNEENSYGTLVQNTMIREQFTQLKEFNDGNVVWAVEWKRVKE